MSDFEILQSCTERGFSDADALAVMGIRRVGESAEELAERRSEILGRHLLEALTS